MKISNLSEMREKPLFLQSPPYKGQLYWTESGEIVQYVGRIYSEKEYNEEAYDYQFCIFRYSPKSGCGSNLILTYNSCGKHISNCMLNIMSENVWVGEAESLTTLTNFWGLKTILDINIDKVKDENITNHAKKITSQYKNRYCIETKKAGFGYTKLPEGGINKLEAILTNKNFAEYGEQIHSHFDYLCTIIGELEARVYELEQGRLNEDINNA